jgi:4-hydroxy-3-methylbut-2-enyl diphosphate reductase
MRINLAKSSGFCFGVKRAIDIALKAASLKKNIYMVGDIVHNEHVAEQIRKSGVKKINRLTSGKNRVFLIQAHGIPQNTLQKAIGLGYEIIDATCPMVKEIHKIVQDMDKEYRLVIVIGDKQHDEVRGIVGQIKGKAIVIEKQQDIPLETIKRTDKACVVVQSTQDIEKVLKIVSLLKRYIRDLKFFNTICRPTRIKQKEIRIMPIHNDIMIIIGSRNSANTKRLYQISKSLNKHSFRINSAKGLKREWFKGVKNVGVAAGASTPDSTTEAIINYIKKFK